MFSVWPVFTSNLNSQTSWQKVKFVLVNFFLDVGSAFHCLCGSSSRKVFFFYQDQLQWSVVTRLVVNPYLRISLCKHCHLSHFLFLRPLVPVLVWEPDRGRLSPACAGCQFNTPQAITKTKYRELCGPQ